MRRRRTSRSRKSRRGTGGGKHTRRTIGKRSSKHTRRTAKHTRRTTRKRSKYTYCTFLKKEFTRDELYIIAKTVGIKNLLPSYTADDLCYLIEENCPQCVKYIRFIVKNYVLGIGEILLALVSAPFSSYYNLTEPGTVYDLLPGFFSEKEGQTVKATLWGQGILKEIMRVLDLMPYMLWVNIRVFRDIYNAYKNRKIINKLGKKVRKVTNNSKLEINLQT